MIRSNGRAEFPIAEVARPAAQEAVHVLHDGLDRQQQPLTRREFTDAVAGMLHPPA